jgi:putative flippase GtrA
MSAFATKLRYGIIAGICFVLGATLIPFFSWLGMHYSIATLIAFMVVALIGFALHSQWTFKVERSVAGLARYTGAMLLNLPLTVIFIGIAHDGFGVPVLYAAPLSSILLFVWNYIAVEWAVSNGGGEEVS